MIRRPPRSTLFPTRRSSDLYLLCGPVGTGKSFLAQCVSGEIGVPCVMLKNFRSKYVGETEGNLERVLSDRKSTRLNSSHGYISYAVFCLKKKKKISIKSY